MIDKCMIYDYSNFNSGDENISIGDDKVSIWYKWYVEIQKNSKYIYIDEL